MAYSAILVGSIPSFSFSFFFLNWKTAMIAVGNTAKVQFQNSQCGHQPLNWESLIMGLTLIHSINLLLNR